MPLVIHDERRRLEVTAKPPAELKAWVSASAAPPVKPRKCRPRSGGGAGPGDSHDHGAAAPGGGGARGAFRSRAGGSLGSSGSSSSSSAAGSGGAFGPGSRVDGAAPVRDGGDDDDDEDKEEEEEEEEGAYDIAAKELDASKASLVAALAQCVGAPCRLALIGQRGGRRRPFGGDACDSPRVASLPVSVSGAAIKLSAATARTRPF